MQSLGFFTRHIRSAKALTSKGFTLAELLVCLAVLGVMASFAIPSWQRVQERSRVEATRDQLMNDLQTARVRALQRGEALQLTRLRDCTWSSTADNDWSCGWQLQRQDTQGILRTHAIHAPLQLLLVNQKEFVIGARGELGSVGTRWSLSHTNSSNLRQYVVCLNSAGRLRWQSGATCA
jgi:prepilin-type N-terminal cleavage/methylation domain-containing protein